MSERSNSRQSVIVAPARPIVSPEAVRAIARALAEPALAVPGSTRVVCDQLRAQLSARGVAQLAIGPALEVEAVAIASAAPLPSSIEVAALAMRVDENERPTSRAAATVLAAAAREVLDLDFLSTACARAATVTGFPQISTRALGGGELQVLAFDETRRTALATTIRLGEGGMESETEVVGVTDGSCTAILDSFDAALAAEGVRFTAPVPRRPTGGVPQSAAARESDRLIRESAPSGAPGQPRRRQPRRASQSL